MKELFDVESLDDIDMEEGEILDDTSIQSKYCPFCNGEKINETDLYHFIVSKYELDVDKEWKEYKNSKD